MALNLLLGRVCLWFHLHDCLVQAGSMFLKLKWIITIFCVLDLCFDSYILCSGLGEISECTNCVLSRFLSAGRNTLGVRLVHLNLKWKLSKWDQTGAIPKYKLLKWI